MWPPIRPLRWSPSSCIRVTSQSLGPQPGSWALRVQTSWAALLMRCVNSSAWRSCEPSLITPRQIGWWRGLTKPLCRWLGSWKKIKKLTGPGHLAKIVYTYNATQSVMMGYSPHYLMFGCRPRLPVDFYFPTLRSAEVLKCGTSAKLCGHCWRLIEGCPSRGPGLVYNRGLKTKMVLWTENRHHKSEAWQSCASQGRCLWREEENQGQMGGQDSWGSTSGHDRHPLVWSERPAWTFMSPTLQPTPPHHHKTMMVWLSPNIRRKTSLGWINGKLWFLPWMSAGTSIEDGWRFQVMCSGHGCLHWQNSQQDHRCFGGGIDISAHICHWIVDWTTTTTAHKTESW